MEIDIKRLEQIVAVARRGSFSAAAEELHITQPGLSRSIAALEERLGIRIFERGRGGASLTPVGALAVAEAQALLRKARALDHNLRLYGRGDAGKVAFGMGPLVSSMVMPGLSSYFLSSRPRLHLRTVVKSVAALLQELMDDDIEMFFSASLQLEASAELAIEPVGQLNLSMMVRADHPLAGRDEVKLADIAAFPILSGDELSTVGRGADSGGFICDNYHILRETALQTDGVWMSSPQFVIEDLQAGRLKEIIPIDDVRPPRVDICLVRREDCTLSPAAEAITGYVRNFFAEIPAAPDSR